MRSLRRCGGRSIKLFSCLAEPGYCRAVIIACEIMVPSSSAYSIFIRWKLTIESGLPSSGGAKLVKVSCISWRANRFTVALWFVRVIARGVDLTPS